VGQNKITNSNIISFEMNVKLNYKSCEMNLKKIDQVYSIYLKDITSSGYIVEFSETFLAKKKQYPNLLNYLNNIINEDIETTYQKLIAKKKFVEKIRNNNF